MAEEVTHELANQANARSHSAARGLACGACGHARLKVVYTRHAPGGRIVRRRECRKCAKRVTTWERAIGQVQMCNESIGPALPIDANAATAAISVSSEG